MKDVPAMLSKAAVGWATLGASVSLVFFSYSLIIRPQIKRRKTSTNIAREATEFLIQKVQEQTIKAIAQE